MPRLANEIRSYKIEPERTGEKCQINIGTKDKPKTCGEVLQRPNGWTWVCRKHGEVY